MKWLDVYDIAIALEDRHYDVDVMTLSFTKLKSLVLGIEGFNDDANGSSEKILEAIQMAWIEERE